MPFGATMAPMIGPLARGASRFAVAASLLACGGAPPAPAVKPTLMDKTTAGENRCVVTKSHERPFVIEWDATDLASFEAKAARDVVFVRYQGCHLTVLDCADASIGGKHGAYRAPEWTSGTVEGFDMSTEQELYAQLPLGAASLSGRLESGQSLRLRYFVSGVSTATRDALYKKDLPERCAGATHFVQAYNLGAFELGAMARGKASAAAGIHGFGAGGSTSKDVSVLKRGGELEACKDEATRGGKRCQVPIRITLRGLEEGAAPAPSPATPKPAAPPSGMDALLAAGKIRNEALRKLQDGDGAGCVQDLDRAREIDTDPANDEMQGQLRGQCTMKAGKCDAGKEILRTFYRRHYGKSADPKTIDDMVKGMAASHCK